MAIVAEAELISRRGSGFPELKRKLIRFEADRFGQVPMIAISQCS
jgi:hypothetical protein